MNEPASPVVPVVEADAQASAMQYDPAPAQPSSEAILRNLSAEKRDISIVSGLIGALLGSIPGVILWVIIGQLGYIAGICGFLMVRGAIFGYTKLAGGINKFGKFLAAAIAFLMPLVAEYLGIAVSIYRAFHESEGVTIAQSFTYVPYFLNEPEVVSGLVTNLLIGYLLFAASFINFKPKQKNVNQPFPQL